MNFINLSVTKMSKSSITIKREQGILVTQLISSMNSRKNSYQLYSEWKEASPGTYSRVTRTPADFMNTPVETLMREVCQENLMMPCLHPVPDL